MSLTILTYSALMVVGVMSWLTVQHCHFSPCGGATHGPSSLTGVMSWAVP